MMETLIPQPVRPADYTFVPAKTVTTPGKNNSYKPKRIAKIVMLVVFTLVYFAIFGAIGYGLFAVRLAIAAIFSLFPVVFGIIGFIGGIQEGHFIWGTIIGAIVGLLVGKLFGWLFATEGGTILVLLILLILVVLLYKWLLKVFSD
jgi:predicted permease